MIALICDSREAKLLDLLSAFDETIVFRGSGQVTDYSRAGGSFRLIVVALDGARGMNAAGRRHRIPVLWLTEQAGFFRQSRRMGVAGFLVKPVSDEILRETVDRLLTFDKAVKLTPLPLY